MSKDNKRLLFFCTAFGSMSGGILNFHLAKWLRREGWQVTVLTTSSEIDRGLEETTEGVRVFYSLPPPIPSYRTIQKLKRWRVNSLLRPLLSLILGYGIPFWQKNAREIACYLVDRLEPHLLLASHPEPKSLLLAEFISRKKAIPWIALMHDPWAKDPINKEGASIWDKLLQGVRERYERRVLQSASALLTFSEEWEFSVGKKNKYVIDRGFDPEYYPRDVRLEDIFTITFGGSLLGLKRDPAPLFEAVARMKKEGFLSDYPLRIRFYLHSDIDRKLVEKLSSTFLIREFVETYPPISHKELLIMECKSACLLLITHQRSFPTGKIGEYLGSKRPILALVPKDSIPARLIQGLGAGFVCATAKEIYEFLKKALRDFYEKGDIEWAPDWEAVEALSWEKQAGKISEILSKYAIREG